MKLSKQAIKALTARPIRFQLALALGFTEIWINKVIERNKENGPLTTAKALQVIEKETGLKQKEILVTEEPVKA